MDLQYERTVEVKLPQGMNQKVRRQVLQKDERLKLTFAVIGNDKVKNVIIGMSG